MALCESQCSKYSGGSSCNSCGGVACFSDSSGGSSGCSNCSNSCTVNCTGVCSALCTGESFKEAQNFILHQKFLKSDIATISQYISHEVTRRSQTPINTNFKVTDKLDDSEVEKIINNLSKINFPVNSTSLSEKKMAKKSLAESIISQMKRANRTVVAGGTF